MKGVYRTSFEARHSQTKKKFGSGIIWHMVSVIVWALSVLSAILTILSLLLPFFKPGQIGFLAWIPLLFPIYYILDILLSFFWLARWDLRRFVKILAVTIIASTQIGLYFQPEFSLNNRQKKPLARKQFTRLVTFNTACRDTQAMVDSIANIDADIICLQEFYNKNQSNWNALASKMNSTSTEWEKIRFGCRTLSRYPIIREGLVKGLSVKDVVWADLKIGKDTLRVINVHLRSTGMLESDVEYVLGGGFLQDSMRKKQVKSILSRFVDNATLRAKQVDILKKFIQGTKHKVCLAGDVNDVPLSYTYRQLSQNLDDTFKRHRPGYVFTYTNFIGLLRLDLILISQDITSLKYEVRDKIRYSDHLPIISELKTQP